MTTFVLYLIVGTILACISTEYGDSMFNNALIFATVVLLWPILLIIFIFEQFLK